MSPRPKRTSKSHRGSRGIFSASYSPVPRRLDGSSVSHVPVGHIPNSDDSPHPPKLLKGSKLIRRFHTLNKELEHLKRKSLHTNETTAHPQLDHAQAQRRIAEIERETAV